MPRGERSRRFRGSGVCSTRPLSLVPMRHECRKTLLRMAQDRTASNHRRRLAGQRFGRQLDRVARDVIAHERPQLLRRRAVICLAGRNEGGLQVSRKAEGHRRSVSHWTPPERTQPPNRFAHHRHGRAPRQGRRRTPPQPLRRAERPPCAPYDATALQASLRRFHIEERSGQVLPWSDPFRTGQHQAALALTL